MFGFRERTEARLSWTGGCLTWMELGDVLISLTTEDGHDLRSPESVGAGAEALCCSAHLDAPRQAPAFAGFGGKGLTSNWRRW